MRATAAPVEVGAGRLPGGGVVGKLGEVAVDLEREAPAPP